MNTDSKKSIVSGEIFQKCYTLDNFKIEEDSSKESNICAIYVSSSGIYYPNTESALEECILKKDTYEWYKTRFAKAKKHIFIRDVAKQFYITGINKEIDNIDKVLDFLRIQTNGYTIYVIGSSAGGYMASVIAAKLDADLLLCFSGYFDLNIVNKDVWFFIERYKYDTDRNKYYNICELLKEYKGLMLYFFPTKLVGDVTQSTVICESDRIIKIPIKSKIHGVPISMDTVKRLMNLSSKEISENLDEIRKYSHLTSRKINCLVFGVLNGNRMYFFDEAQRQIKRVISKAKRLLG